MREFLTRLGSNEDGQDLIEYALLAAAISISCIATLMLIGPKIDQHYVKIDETMKTVP